MEQNNKPLLKAALQCSLPVWLDEVKRYRRNELERRARAAGEILACFGDVLQFGGKAAAKMAKARKETRPVIDVWLEDGSEAVRSPTPALIFNALAEGLACAIALSDDGEAARSRLEYIERVLFVE